MSLSSLCNESADVERKATAAASPTNLGGHANTFSVVYDGLKVSAPQQPSGGTRLEAMRRQVEVSHTFYTPSAVTILTGDRVVFNGGYYHVQWAADEGGKGRVFSIHCLKL